MVHGQNSGTGDTIFNQTDKQGLKQGFWKGYYPNKKVKYTGYFKDNKPVGTIKRYYDDGIIKANMVYNSKGKAFTTLFYQNGTKAAEGNYIGTLKDSIWNYYSYYDKTISNRENYVFGKKEGISVNYFPSGNKSQELGYKNDLKHGIWRQYYDSGTIKLSTIYSDGKRNGQFLLNYPNNQPEWKGVYLNDEKDGKWIHYGQDGKVDSEVEFKNGIAKNAEELDTKEQKMLQQYEKLKGSIPEPEENSFIPGSGM